MTAKVRLVMSRTSWLLAWKSRSDINLVMSYVHVYFFHANRKTLIETLFFIEKGKVIHSLTVKKELGFLSFDSFHFSFNFRDDDDVFFQAENSFILVPTHRDRLHSSCKSSSI